MWPLKLGAHTRGILRCEIVTRKAADVFNVRQRSALGFDYDLKTENAEGG
jgi:hypothetical protein